MSKLVVLVTVVSAAVGLSAVADTVPVGSRPSANPDRPNSRPSIELSDRPVGVRQSVRWHENPKPVGSVSEPQVKPIAKPSAPQKEDLNQPMPPVLPKEEFSPPLSLPKTNPVAPQASLPPKTNPMPPKSPELLKLPQPEDSENDFFNN